MCLPSRYSRLPVELHTSAQPYYGDELRGAVSVRITDCVGRPSITWTDASRRVVGTQACANDLLPGTYRATVRVGGQVARATVEVEAATLPSVVGYDTAPASHDGAWDGSVVARVQNVDTHMYLWSTGEVSVMPELTDVHPGTYSVSVVDASGRAVPHVHACAAAVIGVQAHNENG